MDSLTFERFFLSFLISSQKFIKTVYCTAINSGIFCYYTLCKFAFYLIFMKNLCLLLCNLRRYVHENKARKFYDISTEEMVNC